MKSFYVVLSLVLVCAVPAYSAPLSRSIEFDRLLMHAHTSVSRGDYRSAASDYGHAAKLEMDAPESFYLDYGATLGALGRWKEAKGVLETYFRRFDKQGELYDLALKRYVEAGDRVSTRSEERVRPQLVGMADVAPAPSTTRRSVLPSWAKNNTAPPSQPAPATSYVPPTSYAPSTYAAPSSSSALPPMPVTQASTVPQAPPIYQIPAYQPPSAEPPMTPARVMQPAAIRYSEPVAQVDIPSANNRAALESLIGLYSGEAKDSDDTSRGASCSKVASTTKPHPASDCFYGFHRSMSLNAVDGTAVIGFVKVEYVREHRPAFTADQHGQKVPIHTKMEYYLAIRLWMTSTGLIQGQQKGLCEFMVDERVCAQTQPKGMTPLRARMTSDGGLGLESEKGGGPRIYTKLRGVPELVRTDVVRVVPSLSPFVGAPGESPERPVNVEAKSTALGDTADASEMGSDDADDSVAAGVASAAREILKASVVG